MKEIFGSDISFEKKLKEKDSQYFDRIKPCLRKVDKGWMVDVDHPVYKSEIERNKDQNVVRKAQENIKRDNTLKTKLSWIEKAKAIKPATEALLTGKKVSLEQIQKREQVCANCDKLSLDENMNPICGICTCKVQLKEKKILYLLDYEETEDYGCKHPNGSRWKANDC